MKGNGTISRNRTGIAFSPIHAKQLIAGAAKTKPTMEGDESTPDATRLAYGEDAEPVGTVPSPLDRRAKGASLSVLMDKLGERLAFERSGTRLYAALITKLEGERPLPGGPTVEDLLEIQREEHAHFELLSEAIERLGGDPTAVTPSADVGAVAAMGLSQVINDPRTTMTQCLQAALVAELTDNDGWTLLAALAERLGHSDLAKKFRGALAEEDKHLARVRRWITDATLRSGGVRR